MKKKHCIILAICAIAIFTACGKGNPTTTNNSSNNNNEKPTPSLMEEKKEEKTNPLSAISENYKNGTLQSQIYGNIDLTKVQQLLDEYSGYIAELGNYMTLHQNDFKNGKSFKDLDDYEKSFKKFYQWANNIIYFNGQVDEASQNMWNTFKNILSHHIEVLDKSYDEDGTTVTTTISQLLQDIAEKATSATEDYILEIHDGETVSLTDDTNELSLTLSSVDFEQEVHSLVEDTNQFSRYYSDIPGETYIVMKLFIKNTGGNSISEDIFDQNKISLTYDNKYNYQMIQLDTQSIVMSQYWQIEPLKSQEIYFFQSIPDELVGKPYTIDFSLPNAKSICRYNGN